MKLKRNQQGFHHLIILVVIVVIGVIGLVGFRVWKTTKHSGQNNDRPTTLQLVNPKKPKDNPFARNFSRGKCQGSGTVEFTHLPMDIADVSTIHPYGLMADAHVLPTSHGYFYPADMQSAWDTYPVYAIADGFIVQASHRGEHIGDSKTTKQTNDYSLQFEHSCTFYSYYDLLTSLSPELQSKIGELKGFDSKLVRIPVKAGQQVGKVGGQSVDFGVWNFEKTPNKFVNPNSYTGDEERLYLDDMFSHFSKPLQEQIFTKALRTAEPRSGRVDYDIDTKLVGNWFKQGSGGFNGPPAEQGKVNGRYWDGHLAIVYDYLNPSEIVFSIGDWSGLAQQFSIRGNSPDPAKIGVESGLIKLELVSKGGGQPQGQQAIQGVVLLQMTEPRSLKLERFPGKTAAQVNSFTSAAITYER